jgi:hypothetical protein
MAITIPHTFVNGAGHVADADEVNENFNAVQAEINGNLKNVNFAAAGNLTVESKLKFAITGGHIHNDTDSDKLALAVLGDDDFIAGAQGSLKYKTGTVNINSGVIETITFASPFVRVPMVMVYGNDVSTLYLNNGSLIVTLVSYYYFYDVSTTGFKITNQTIEHFLPCTWVAIGI